MAIYNDILASPQEKLEFHERYPTEFAFFKRHWVHAINHKAYYLRHSYQSCGKIPAWFPQKYHDGEWILLHPKHKVEVMAMHLDYDGWLKRLPPKERVYAKTAYWLGTTPGDKTLSDNIDLDSHDYVGWYGVPVPSRFGTMRMLPIPKQDILFFKVMKKTYDYHPGRIWMTSSANMGKGVWRLHYCPVDTAANAASVRERLDRCGLDFLPEIYPRPRKTENSFGKAHRRPFGMDSGTHTAHGYLTDPIDQIRACINYQRPNWGQLFYQHITELSRIYDVWEKDEMPDMPLDTSEAYRDRPKAEVLEELRNDLHLAIDWLRSGSPYHDSDFDCLRKAKPVAREDHVDVDQTKPVSTERLPERIQQNQSEPERIIQKHQNKKEEKLEYNESCCNSVSTLEFPSKAVKSEVDPGFWTYVKDLAQHGVPVPDKLDEFLFKLARPLLFRDYYGQDNLAELAEADLFIWVTTKHKGHVTRILNGQDDSVRHQIRRIINRCLDSTNDRIKQYYCLMRQNDQRYPHRIERLTTLIRNLPLDQQIQQELQKEEEREQRKERSCCISVSGLETPLPEALQERIENFSGRNKVKMFATRLVNLLHQKKGIKLSQATLYELLGYRNPTRLATYKKILVKAGVLPASAVENYGYQMGRHAKRYTLTKWATKVMNGSGAEQHTAAS